MNKLKKYLILIYGVVLTFIFIYTLNINLNPVKTLNYVNMIFLFLCFIFWLFLWYLFFIKDIIKSDDLERNRISLVLVLIGIAVFYYNPLPAPEKYFLDLNRTLYFILAIVFLISFIVFARKQPFFLSGIFVITPLTINSYFINIQKSYEFFDKYPYFIFSTILILLVLQFGYKQLISKKSNSK